MFAQHDHVTLVQLYFVFFFFFNDTATTEIYTLSLHDALPICCVCTPSRQWPDDWPTRADTATRCRLPTPRCALNPLGDRKSTRLNSSHANISYAVFCLKKKKKTYNATRHIFKVTHCVKLDDHT